MLKISIVFGLVLVSVTLGAPPKKELLDIPEPVAKTIVQAIEGCSSDSMALKELFGMLREGTWNDDPKYKKLVGCAFVASGFATSDGNVIVDRAVAIFDKEDVKKVIVECANDQDGPTPDEKLYRFYKCFQMKSAYTMNLHN